MNIVIDDDNISKNKQRLNIDHHNIYKKKPETLHLTKNVCSFVQNYEQIN